MIFHTAMPLELVFENFDQLANQKLSEIRLGEATMLVEQTGGYEGRIVRLISPNPQDYLNPRWAPGQIVSFRPDFS